MTRIRSPNYPSVSLKQAIVLIEKIHKANRTNVISREVAAEAMGYSGLTGRSLKIIASLIQFGLLAKAGSGDVKVTPTAVDILHGDENDRLAAIKKAGLSPQLFRDIHERFPEGIPSQNAIRSYLVKQEFADVAIGPAITAFIETYDTLEGIRESENHDTEAEGGTNPPEAAKIETAVTSAPSAHAPVVHATDKSLHSTGAIMAEISKMELNKIGMSIDGNRVAIAGFLNINGLSALERKIAGLKTLLDPDDSINEE
ncbi:MAG: hypothetical protein KJS79_14465 [Rhodospirillales bacterium]|nr:hypothetical protein [Rhodospirillales bacterium]